MGGFKGKIYRKALLLHPRYRSFLYILTVTNSGTVYSVSLLSLFYSCDVKSSLPPTIEQSIACGRVTRG